MVILQEEVSALSTDSKLFQSMRETSISLKSPSTLQCLLTSYTSEPSGLSHNLEGPGELLDFFFPSIITPSPDPASSPILLSETGSKDSSPENRLKLVSPCATSCSICHSPASLFTPT